MIRIDEIWLATEPMDMRAGTETVLARVIAVFGAAKPHCAYLFANRRAKRAAAIMSLIQSARLHGHDPYAYSKDVLTRLPTQRVSEVTDLLPNN
ncbi:transposase domain-containing protein [Pseudomonas marginalis]|nr:transposase domain-containing protein [Pseudomonas marginalis]WPN21667.1 transposase domain-containing protein [Pseudomonas marginalis]